MFFSQELFLKAFEIINIARDKKLKIASAESCTGGLLAALLTEVSGASDVFDCGFVVYSNQAKNQMLQVKKESIIKFGAVSEEVAKEMALGVLKNSVANVGVSITGIAGPNGGSKIKPVGLVYISIAKKNGDIPSLLTKKFNFSGNRQEIRLASLSSALEIIKNSF